jgi:thiamine biosynthesis lipoprotein
MRLQRIWFRTLLALLIGLAGTHLAGCSQQPKFEFTRLCMGVQTRVTVHATDLEEAVSAAVPAFDRIEVAEQALSDYRPASDAMRLCDAAMAAPEEWLPIAGDLRECLMLSQSIGRGTDGAFSVAIGPAVKLWRAARAGGELPSEDQRREAVRLSDWRNIELDAGSVHARLVPGVRLDFGGIGKGYAAQKAVDDLRQRGFPCSMVAIAGDIAVGDAPPGAAGWRIHVKDGLPDLLLVNAAVSTSGDSEQYVEIDGSKYSHIVDPSTGLGFLAPRGVLVTVVARDGAVADALGTALYALPLDRAPKILGEFDAAAVLVIGDPEHDPEIRIIDPHGMLRWAE